MRLNPFDTPIKSLYFRSFVVFVLFARFFFLDVFSLPLSSLPCFSCSNSPLTQENCLLPWDSAARLLLQPRPSHGYFSPETLWQLLPEEQRKQGKLMKTEWRRFSDIISVRVTVMWFPHFSKHFPFGDQIINCYNLFYWRCIDIFRRKLILKLWRLRRVYTFTMLEKAPHKLNRVWKRLFGSRITG